MTPLAELSKSDQTMYMLKFTGNKYKADALAPFLISTLSKQHEFRVSSIYYSFCNSDTLHNSHDFRIAKDVISK